MQNMMKQQKSGLVTKNMNNIYSFNDMQLFYNNFK